MMAVASRPATNAVANSHDMPALPAGADAMLQQFLAVLAKWNRVYNLTAITDPAQMATLHLQDSLAILPALDRVLAGVPGPRLLDVGSGAGLPGIPLAVARPGWQMTLLDSNGKKTAFIQQAVAELRLPNVSVVTARVAEFGAVPFDVIVSRAFASLADFTATTRHLLGPHGCWAAMKGAVPDDELRELPAGVVCTDIVPLQVAGLAAQRHLLLLKAND